MRSIHSWKNLPLIALLAPVVVVVPVITALPLRSQSQSQPTNTTKLRKNFTIGPAKEMPVPFHVGETLDYRVSWSAFSNAGSAELSIPERRNLFGWNTWHFRAVAHTQGSVRTLFNVDDQFDSYTDVITFESRQYETHLSEMGRIEDQVLHFAPTGQVSHAPLPHVAVRPGTRDPLGFAYAVRAADWSTPEVRMSVYDGRDLFDASAKRESSGEMVKVPAGTFSTSRISISIFRGGKEIPAVHFVTWLTDDAAKTPVIIQAELPFGNIRAELTSGK